MTRADPGVKLREYDRGVREEGFRFVCGVDEAGRGPLAGPVFAAAVILDPDREIAGLNDSKKLSPARREKLYEEIRASALAYHIASATSDEIDAYNILQATLLAMRRAVEGLTARPELALVDGVSDPGFSVPVRLIKGGDGASACIAAASILAKVARDRHLLELDALYPEYGFARHKGYGTKLHYEMLDRCGPCPEHRRSFLRKWEARQGGR